MATSNTGLQITNLDFPSIKASLRTFLQSQDTFKDYNFDGSALSTLIDLLAYNTQYNAYYLNMVANEMFLDSAVQRNSVVSHAKLLNYTPKSAAAPKATVNVQVNQVNTSTLTLPKFTPFISEAIDSVNYTFVTADATTVQVASNTAVFANVNIIQGNPASWGFAYNSATNPKQMFEIPDADIDTSTLVVSVQESSSNTFSTAYTLADDYAALTPTSLVYFLQEGQSGKYQIFFGDGVLGQKLKNGNIVNTSYVVTSGKASFGANAFTIMSSVGGFSNIVTTIVSSAFNGADRETIDSIKFAAPKAYAAQGRAVTREDYVYLIQNNTTNLPIDSVSVWGGEQNNPPVYGQIFCAVKPSGGYTLTPTQKDRLINEVIRPISVLTVVPTIVDPDYTYIKLMTTVLYDTKKTTQTSGQIKQAVINSITNFSRNTLNTFNSTFKMPELITTIQTADPSIITNETNIRLQKKFYPNMTKKASYTFDFGVALKRNFFNTGLSSYPDFSVRDPVTPSKLLKGVFFEEVPSVVGGVDTISVVNTGFGYTKTPTVVITGDGTGATAVATIAAGRVTGITVTNTGQNYTEAVITIIPASDDVSGALAYALANLQGATGTLRTFYYKDNTKNILEPDAGTINYSTGVVTLKDFSPVEINNSLGQFIISVQPESTIISSTFNKIITVDEFDPESIIVNTVTQ